MRDLLIVLGAAGIAALGSAVAVLARLGYALNAESTGDPFMHVVGNVAAAAVAALGGLAIADLVGERRRDPA